MMPRHKGKHLSTERGRGTLILMTLNIDSMCILMFKLQLQPKTSRESIQPRHKLPYNIGKKIIFTQSSDMDIMTTLVVEFSSD